jgi:hypothetical protein
VSASNPLPTTVTSADGRVFERLGSTPYQRKDGVVVELHVWQGKCVACDQAYRIRATARPSRKSLAIITCPVHRNQVRRRAKTAR